MRRRKRESGSEVHLYTHDRVRRARHDQRRAGGPYVKRYEEREGPKLRMRKCVSSCACVCLHVCRCVPARWPMRIRALMPGGPCSNASELCAYRSCTALCVYVCASS
eukprot:6213745-Pleurochrysis_carterae.AAC.8